MVDGVEFDEDGSLENKYHEMSRPVGVANTTAIQRLQKSKEARGLSAWLIRRKYVKDMAGAQKVLLGVIVANLIIIAVVVIFFI